MKFRTFVMQFIIFTVMVYAAAAFWLDGVHRLPQWAAQFNPTLAGLWVTCNTMYLLLFGLIVMVAVYNVTALQNFLDSRALQWVVTGGDPTPDLRKKIDWMTSVSPLVRKGFWRKTLLWLAVTLYFAVVFALGYDGYVKSAIYLFCLEGVWFILDRIAQESLKEAAIKIEEIKKLLPDLRENREKVFADLETHAGGMEG